MNISDLRPYIAATSLTKLKKGQIVQTDVINKLCWLLNCQPADIMEYIEVKDEKIFTSLDKMKMALDAGLHYYDDMTEEQLKKQPPTDKKTREDGYEIVKEIEKH